MKSNLLTDTELELMTIIWKIGEGNVADVINHLPEHRKLAYTSVSTILRILEQKKILTARKEGRGHVYVPVLAKEDYETRSLKHLVDKVFDGTPVSIVKQLLSTVKLTDAEIDDLKKIIATKTTNKGSQK